MTIEMKPVSSSNISKVGYSPEDRIMAVEFSDGSIYHYHDVEQNVHDELIAAKSVGSHLHKHVKGIYRHSKQ